MAAKVMGFDKALQTLEAVNISDADVSSILAGAADIALPVMQDNLNRVLSGESTGELANSLGISQVKMNSSGVHNIKVGFRENGRGTMTNAAKAANLEYGNSRGQPPRPWFARSVKKVRRPIEEHIIKSVEEKVKS
jgi:hypothetical protein